MGRAWIDSVCYCAIDNEQNFVPSVAFAPPMTASSASIARASRFVRSEFVVQSTLLGRPGATQRSTALICATFAVFVVLALKKGQHISLGIHPFLEFRHAGAAFVFVICLVGLSSIYRASTRQVDIAIRRTRTDFLWHLRFALSDTEQRCRGRVACGSSYTRGHMRSVGNRMVR